MKDIQGKGHLLIGIVCIALGIFSILMVINSGVYTNDDCVKYFPSDQQNECKNIPVSLREKMIVPTALIFSLVFFIPSLFELRKWRKEVQLKSKEKLRS